MIEDKVYDLENLPEDAEVFTGKFKEFDPIDPSEIYQAEIVKVELRDNPFYKPNEKDAQKKGVKYQLSFEYAILHEGKFYGRRIWDTTSLAFKPDGKRGPTKLYKIVMAALKLSFDWEQCAEFAPDLKTLYKSLKESVVGKQIKIAIENITNPDTKKVRTKIVTYYEAKKEMPPFDAEKSKGWADVIEDMTIKAKEKKKEAVVKKEEELDNSPPF